MKHFLLATTLIFSAPAAMACETVTIGDLTVEHAWSKATIGAGRPGVFYVEIKNNGSADDALRRGPRRSAVHGVDDRRRRVDRKSVV